VIHQSENAKADQSDGKQGQCRLLAAGHGTRPY
jgi:hypothetical protein